MPDLANKTRIILVFDLILFVACIVGIFQTYEKAGLEPNRHISFYTSDDRIIVSQISDPELQSLFFPGDQIISIAGHPVSNKDDIEFIFDSFEVGEIVSIQIERNREILLQSITLPRYYSWLYLIVQIIVGFVFFINGVFVIYKRPDELAANIWHWATICTAIIITCTWGRFSIQPFGIGYIIRDIFSAAYAFVSTLYLHLTYVFPRNKLKKPNILFAPLYGFSIVLAIWMIVTFELSARQFSMDMFHYHMIAFDITRTYFAVVILWGMGNLIHSYLKAREPSEKRKIRWILSGLAIGPPTFVIFWQIPQLLSFDNIIPEEIIVLIMIIVPISFTISIVKYHLFDIDVILRRSSVYFFTISIILVLYVGIVAITAFFIGTITVSTSIIASVITAIIIPFVFEPARIKIQNFIDRKFFRIHYDYRVAQRDFTNELNNCVAIESVTEKVTGKLDQLFKPECFVIALNSLMTNTWKLFGRNEYQTIPENVLKQLLKITERTQHKLIADRSNVESAVDYLDISKFNLSINKIVLIIPIVSQQNKILGFLFCGKKISELQYSIEDIDLLKTICTQTGLTVERILLHKELILQGEETQRLKELNQTKSLFVSNVSHEMQTPLTSIKMFSEILQSKNKIPEAEQKEYLEIIEGESDRLSNLIKNVLDFSKIERGVMQYNLQSCQLNKIINEVLKSIKYQLSQNGFEVNIELSKEPLEIKADIDAIKVVLFNLISNSVKYSDKDKYLSISSYKDNKNTIVDIIDKGIGISKKDQQYIFQAYYRAGENKQNTAGTGLGLTLVHNIMEAHGGNIELTSTLGKGTNFRLIFPGEINV